MSDDKRRFLKVKIKSLAAEAKIIRVEEARSRGELRCELHEHRVRDVRIEARAALLAYNFIRGRTYAQTEPRGDRPPAMDRVQSMVKKYGRRLPTWEADLAAWFAARSEGQGISTPSPEGSTPSARSTPDDCEVPLPEVPTRMVGSGDVGGSSQDGPQLQRGLSGLWFRLLRVARLRRAA